jgi:hypothetical protein
VALGGVLAKPVTSRVQDWANWMNDPGDFSKLRFAEGDSIPEQIADSLLDVPIGLGGAAGLAAISGIGTWLSGGDTDNPDDNPALRGARDFSSLGFGGDDQSAQQQQTILPSELPAFMDQIGVSPEVQTSAMSQLQEDVAIARAYAEQGIPMSQDEEGNPVVLTPDEAEQAVTQQFLMSLPELIDAERQQQEALSRAAMFQAVMGNYMDPYIDQANSLADAMPGMLNVESLAPEVQAPMRQYADALAAQSRSQAATFGAMGRAIPTVAALEGYANQQQQFDQALQARMLQAQLDAMLGTGAAGVAGTEEDILAAGG